MCLLLLLLWLRYSFVLLLSWFGHRFHRTTTTGFHFPFNDTECQSCHCIIICFTQFLYERPFLSSFVQYFCKDCISATTSFNARREFFVCRCIIIIKLCFRFIYSVSSKTHNSKPLFHSLIQPHKHTHTHRHTDIIFSSLFFHSMCNKRTQLKHMSDIHFCLFSVSLLARSSSLYFFVLDLCSVLHCCFVSLFFSVFPSYCLFYTCFARLL